MGEIAYRPSARAGHSLPRGGAERRGLLQWRRERLRDSSAVGQFAPEELLRNLGFGRGASSAPEHSIEALLLHQRSLPLAQHHLPAPPTHADDGGSEGMEEG